MLLRPAYRLFPVDTIIFVSRNDFRDARVVFPYLICAFVNRVNLSLSHTRKASFEGRAFMKRRKESVACIFFFICCSVPVGLKVPVHPVLLLPMITFQVGLVCESDEPPARRAGGSTPTSSTTTTTTTPIILISIGQPLS